MRRAIRRALGCVLCAAAVLKFMDLVASTSPSRLETVLKLSGSCVEGIVGIALVLGVRPAAAVPAAGLLFVVLAGVAFMGILRGASSCGCFGALSLPPWAMLTFDGGAACAMLLETRAACGWIEHRVSAIEAACFASFFLGLGVGAAHDPPLGRVATALSVGEIEAADTVLIDPQRMVGRPLPLLHYIAINVDLSKGAWKVILAKPGCRKCEDFFRGGGCRAEEGERVAVIVGGDDAGWALPSKCRAPLGRLSRLKQWVFDAPLTLTLSDGFVVEVR